MEDLFQKIYRRLKQLGWLQIQGTVRIRYEKEPDLFISRLGEHPRFPGSYVIALTQTNEIETLLTLDIEIRIDVLSKRAIAFSYSSHSDKDNHAAGRAASLRDQNKLNQFILQWLKKLKVQRTSNE